MKILREITDAALLGIDRKPVDIGKLPEIFKEKLSSVTEEEKKLLDALTYLAYYEDTEIHFIEAKEEINSETISEELVYTNTEFCEMIKDLIEDEIVNKNELLKDVLLEVKSRNQIVLPGYVIALIKVGSYLNEEVKGLIKEVIGKRGKNILTYYPELKYMTENTITFVWEEATSKERLLYFEKLRYSDSVKSIRMIEPDFLNENVRDQLSYLNLISETLSENDIHFLSSIWEQYYKNLSPTKKLERQCKLVNVAMLIRLNYQSEIDKLSKDLQNYIETKKSKKVFGVSLGNDSTVLTIPREQDKFWNGQYLSENYGIEEQNTNIKLFDYDPYFWLSEMIESFSFKFWTPLLNKSYKEAIQYFLTESEFITTIQDKKVPILRPAIIKNALKTKDQDLIKVITENLLGDDVDELIDIMSIETFENYITTHKQHSNIELLVKKAESGKTWSISFSKQVIASFVNLSGSNNFWISKNHGNIIAGVFNPQAYDYLKSLCLQNQNLSGKIEQTLLIPIEHTMNIRKKINKLKEL